MAVSPQYGSAGGNLGTFLFQGNTIGVTQDMVYGVPPLEANLAADPGDLSTHSVYPTYLSEYGFSFAGSNQSADHNSQSQTGLSPTAGTALYYTTFNVDVFNLKPGYVIHFDLYNESVKTGDIDVREFAPYSHDAQSGHTQQVPEPTSLTLLGAGCITLAVALKRQQNARQNAKSLDHFHERRGQ